MLNRPAAHTLLAWGLALFMLPGAAMAECTMPPLDGQSAQEALDTLRRTEAKETQCQKDAPYLYSVGRVLNQLGRFEEAIDPLEGALLYQSDFWPSQLEYAIALEGAGDHASALGLLRNLAQDPQVPPAARSQIEALLGRSVHTVAASNRTVGIHLSTGYDNNLLGATSATQFDLTLPSGVARVQLTEDQRPRAGGFARAEAVADGLLDMDATRAWRYSLAASLRTSPGYAAADQSQWSGLLERSNPTANGPYLQLQYQNLVQAGTAVVQQTLLGAGVDTSLHGALGLADSCRLRAGLDLQSLSYPGSAELNGRMAGFAVHSSCPANGWQLQLRLGQDQPAQASRPGGVQNQLAVRVAKRTPLGAGTLSLDWLASHQQDEQPYSQFLGNTVRSISKTVARAEYRWQSPTWGPYVGMEWLQQHSTISLFDVQNQILTIGFRSAW